MRKILFVLTLLAGCLVSPGIFAADAYPARPITLLVPFGPGLSTDAIARYMADEVGKIVGQPLIVDNRAGANGLVGTTLAAKAPADGYSLVLASNGTHAGNMALVRKLPYDAEKDFTPVGVISAAPWALAVRPDLPARDMPEFLRYAAAHKATVTVAHGSASSMACVAMLETKGNIDVTDVPYKSLQPAMYDLQAGRIDASFLPLGVAITAHKAGKIRVLAISAEKRSDLAPDIPTISEFLPGYELTSWIGIMAPMGTPPEMVKKLHAAMGQVLARPATVEKLSGFGHDVLSMSSAQFGQLISSDIVRWKKLVKDAHLELQ